MSFYDILLEELSHNPNNPNNPNNSNQDDICLITKEPLQDNFITLDCGHKFNYLSLYNELLKQKANTNYFEIINIKINETKCPYCRQITPKILPYIDMNGVKIVKGVTSPKTYSMKLNDCQWIFLNGKKKGIQCKCSAIKTENGVYCKLHETIVLKKKSTLASVPSTSSATSEELTNICKKYTISTLKFFLRSFKLKVSGCKTQLIERLVNYNLNNPNIILT
jgi:hypothetical protein